MKKIIGLAAIIATMFAASAAHADAVYNYEYSFADGTVVNGSFTGTARIYQRRCDGWQW